MRYTIPAEKEKQDEECIQLLRTVTGEQAQAMDEALQGILELADKDYVYQEEDSYERLFSIYDCLGLTGGKEKDELFPEDSRSEKNLKQELDKLWCVLQLQSLENNPTLMDTYKKWQSDPKKYKNFLVKKDMEESRQRSLAGGEQKKAPLPLVDKNSPYYDLVAGTAYEELFDQWNAVREFVGDQQKSAQILKQDMDQLLSRMQLHYISRNQSGSCLPMTKREYEELTDLFGECIKDVTRLETTGNEGAIYNTLSTLLLQNYNQLKGLSPDQLLPLAHVLRGSKIPTVELQNTQNDPPVGAFMSSREAVEYIDENGGLRQGLFTPEFQETSEFYDAEKIFKRYMEQYPDYEAYFKRILGIGDMRAELNAFRTAAIYTEQKVNVDALNFYIKHAAFISVEHKEDENFRGIMKKLSVEIDKNRTRHGVMSQSGIKSGDEIAKRSSAMNDVANRLGFPKLLAGSRRVVVKRQGENISGVMMDAAGPDMADPAYLTNGDPFYTVDISQFDSKEMLSSLADLQILDYLCANTDRHANNFFIRQDFSDPQHPKLSGVQGIDNDNSFGALKTGGVLRLAKPENLKIITPKMAAAIEAMTPRELTDLLKPYQFKKEQVTAASERLTQLQNMIRNGRKQKELPIREDKVVGKEDSIHIVKEEEWNQLTLDMLIPEKVEAGIDPISHQPKYVTPSNIFYMADTHLGDTKLAKSNKMIGVDNRGRAPVKYSKQGLEIDRKKLMQLQQEEYRKLQDIKKRMDDNGGNHLQDRSSKFRSMYTAFQNYTKEYEKMEEILSGKKENLINPQPEVGKKAEPRKSMEDKLKECYRNLESARQNLEQQIRRYRTKTHILKIKPDNQARIDAAGDLLNFIRGKRESEKFLESGTELQARHKAKIEKKNDLQLADYLQNQIYGRMKTTLQSNLKKHKANDPVHVAGIDALKAQSNLWNYAQSFRETGSLSVQTDKQSISVEQLQKAIRNKVEDRADMKSVCADLEKIRKYATELEKSKTCENKEAPTKLRMQIEDVISRYNAAMKEYTSSAKKNGGERPKEKPQISGREVKGILNTLYTGELGMEKSQPQAEKQIPTIKVSQKQRLP